MSKKEPVEINCAECNTDFRLWIPVEHLSEWEKGVRISCVRCGAQHLVKKGKTGLNFVSLKALAEDRIIKEKMPAEAPLKSAPPPAPRPAAQKAEPVPAQPRQVAAAQQDGKEYVLLIEDDRLAREMAEHTLKDIGISLAAAKNGSEALRFLKKSKVCLIITDLYLKNPGDPESQIDGEDLLKKISDLGFTIPAIITTGKDIIDDLVLDPKWFDLRVKGFIQKGNPFWVEELKLKIKEVLYKG